VSDAIKKLHDYLAMSPSVVYPEDVLAYLSAIEDENAKLRLQIHWIKKGDIYAYEAGYHDGATNYELDHCPSCKNIADLQDALDENAKLRELVRDMWLQLLNAYDRKEVDEFADRMRELSMEVVR